METKAFNLAELIDQYHAGKPAAEFYSEVQQALAERKLLPKSIVIGELRNLCGESRPTLFENAIGLMVKQAAADVWSGEEFSLCRDVRHLRSTLGDPGGVKTSKSGVLCTLRMEHLTPEGSLQFWKDIECVANVLMIKKLSRLRDEILNVSEGQKYTSMTELQKQNHAQKLVYLENWPMSVVACSIELTPDASPDAIVGFKFSERGAPANREVFTDELIAELTAKGDLLP